MSANNHPAIAASLTQLKAAHDHLETPLLASVSGAAFREETDTTIMLLKAISAEEIGSDVLLLADSWKKVQQIVRLGLAKTVFSIGDKLYCNRSGVKLEWDVIGIDHDTPSDPHFTHSLTLQLHDCFPTTLQFDAPEAFYYAENGLEAGTYHFAIDSAYDVTRNDLNHYQFTLTQAVPVGGQLTFPWGENFNASTIKVNSFASATSKTAIEQVAVSEGTDGRNLDTLIAAGDFVKNLNSIHRVRYGSNNYKESAIRQWLNKSKVAGSVWAAQNNFDRPPTWYTDNNTAGFVDGMDADFLAVLGKTHITVARSAVTDGGGYDEMDDVFFLLSKSEVYGGVEVSGVDEGAPYPYYADYSKLSAAGESDDTNRIKRFPNGNVADYWLCRTPNVVGNAGYTRKVNSTGGVKYHTDSSNGGIAPACNII